MTLSPPVVAALACPVCGRSLAAVDGDDGHPPGTLGCAAGHRFDVARQGHVTLTARPIRHPGDTPDMLAARQVVQAAGLHAVITDALVAAVPEEVRLVVDVGAGTAHHLAAVLDARPAAHGVAVDSSSHAGRRAARAHPRIGAVVADATERLPLGDGVADVVLVVFAPRHGEEIARILSAGGAVVVVTPTPAHMAELITPLGLLAVAPAKREHLDASLAPALARTATATAQATVTASGELLEAMVAMGPNAFHHTAEEIAALVARLHPPVEVTLAVEVATFRHRRKT